MVDNGDGSDAMELTSYINPGYEDSLCCPVCENRYNFTENAPLTLPCKHNICTKDFAILKEKKLFKCPVCNQPHPNDCQFKMDMRILQVIDDLNTVLVCKEHNKKNNEVDLSEKRLYCPKCKKKKDPTAHRIEPLKSFIEKMKEARNWRRTIINRTELDPSTFLQMIADRESELLDQLDHEFPELPQPQKKALGEQINQTFGDLKTNIKIHEFHHKSKFAMPNEYLELEIPRDLEFSVFQMESKDLKLELDKWSAKVRADEIYKGFKEKLERIQITKEQEPELKFQESDIAFDFKKLLAGECDLIGGIISGMTGLVHIKKRKYEAAIECLKRMQAIAYSYFSAEHQLIGRSFFGIGIANTGLGKSEKNIQYQLKAINIYKKSLGENHQDIADCYHNLGSAYRSEGKYEQAKENYQKALEIRRLHYGEEDTQMIGIYNSLGNLFRLEAKYQNAYEMHKKALDIAKGQYGPHHPLVADSYDDMGVIQTYQLNTEQGLDYLLKALEIRKQNYGEMHPTVANSYNNLGLVYKVEGNYEDALDNYILSLKIRKSTLGEENPSTATVYNNLGVIYRNLHKWDEAIKHHKKALEIRKKLFGENHLEIARTFNSMAKVYLRQNKKNEAKSAFRSAIEISEKSVGNQHQDTIKFKNNLLKIEEQEKVDAAKGMV